MAGLSDEQRAEEVQLLKDLARSLRDFTESTAGAEHKQAIIGFAAQAAGYAGKITKAPTPAAAAALVKEVSKKREKWTELLSMLVVAVEVQEGDAAVAEAEAKLRKTATELRAVASQGSTGVFKAIGEVAKAAEDGLAEFLAAESYKEKFEVVQKVEQARTTWLQSMDTMRTGVLEKEEAEKKEREADMQRMGAGAGASGDSGAKHFSLGGGECVYVAEDGGGELGDMYDALSAFNACISMPFDMPAMPEDGQQDGMPSMSAAGPPMRFDMPAMSSSPAAELEKQPAPPVARELVQPEAAREKLVAFLFDEPGGLLQKLRDGAAKVQEDERFEACHDDAVTLNGELAIAASVMDDSLDDRASGEAKVKVTRAVTKAKKAAFNVQKYDIYVCKGDMPKLGKNHSSLLNCARAAVDLCDLLKQEAQGGVDCEKAAAFLNELDFPWNEEAASASDAVPAASNDVLV